MSDAATSKSSDLYRLLVEQVRDYAIFALDTNGYVQTWNAGAARLKGYAADEIIGKHFSVFYPQERIAERFPEFELREADRVGHFEDEGWRIRKDGSRFWANVVITALRDETGALTGFAKVTRDLTERRAAQERRLADERRVMQEEALRATAELRARDLTTLATQLKEQTERAETANKAKGEFLAAMSHELRTPLNAIGGYAQLLELGVSGPLTEQQREQIGRIRRSQAHLLGVINDILNFSRIEAGQVSYSIEPIELRDIVEAVTPMIAPQAQAKGLRIVVDLDAETPSARGDRSKVEQVLLNLLSNAVKFTEPGGTIMIHSDADDRYVSLVVNDTGIGIPNGQIESVFAPFVQVGRTLSNPTEGTGLGLAISRDLARAMGGDLVATSEEGAGSVFTFSLPRA